MVEGPAVVTGGFAVHNSAAADIIPTERKFSSCQKTSTFVHQVAKES